MKRTFFIISPKPSPTVPLHYTCDDIKEGLIVERVDARLTGTEVSVQVLMDKFPDAVHAAAAWGQMKAKVKADNSIAGPFIMLSEEAPTTDDLVAWWVARNAPSDVAVPAIDTPAADVVELASSINDSVKAKRRNKGK